MAQGPVQRRDFLKTLGLGMAGLSLPTLGPLSCAGNGSAARPPNFVFLLVDDLGWRDLGAYGSTFHLTPHIDALAASGMRFTQAYAASPVCSPTRASLLTGKHPARLHITDWIGGSQRGELLPAEYEDHLLVAVIVQGKDFLDVLDHRRQPQAGLVEELSVVESNGLHCRGLL